MLAGRLAPSLSPLLVATLLGFLVANVHPIGPRLAPGLAVTSRRVLRIGVALLGMQIALGEIGALGWGAVVVVIAVVAGGLALGVFVGRALGVNPARALLLAVGTSICGAAAVVAAASVSESEEEDIAVALTLIVTIGSVAMIVFPLLAAAAGFSDEQAGAWLGGSIHEVGQVVVAAGIVGGNALHVAVVVKLTRVLLLAPVLVLLTMRLPRTPAADRIGSPIPSARPPVVPLFVAVFVGLVALRSSVALPTTLLTAAQLIQNLALAAAMFSLGCSIPARALRTLRTREIGAGAVLALAVAVIALPITLG